MADLAVRSESDLSYLRTSLLTWGTHPAFVGMTSRTAATLCAGGCRSSGVGAGSVVWRPSGSCARVGPLGSRDR